MPHPKSALILLPLLSLLTLGCASDPLRIPILSAPVHALKPLPPAVLHVPVVVNLPALTQVEKDLSDFVKADMAKVENSLTKELGTKVWWDPLDWEFNGNTLTARVNLHYKKTAASPAKGTPSEQTIEEEEKQVQ